MATHKSALKRAKQSKLRRLRNMSYKTRARRAVKDLRSVLAGNSPDEAQEKFKKTVSIIQKTASKGVIHKKNASRKISRLARQVNQLSPS